MLIGIDVGGTNMSGALATETGQIVSLIRRKTHRADGAKAGLSLITGMIAELTEAAGRDGLPVRRIGIGFGGPIDFERGIVLLSHHVAGWQGTPLRDEMEARFGIPVVLDNDANAGTLGEWKFGSGRGLSDLLYVNIGTGIGGGIIAGGRLVRGSHNLAGEIGHIVVSRSGPLCTCGKRGCLEACASGDALARRGSEALGSEVSGPDVFALAVQGDHLAQDVISAVVEDLAHGLGTAVGLLNPAAVIIGGGLSEAPDELFLQPLRRAVPAYCLGAASAALRIETAQLRYDAGVIGAVALALG